MRVQGDCAEGKSAFVLFVVIVVIINAIIFFLGRTIGSKTKKELSPGQIIRDFSLVDMDGNAIGITQAGEDWKFLYFTLLATDKDNRDVRFLDWLNRELKAPGFRIMGILRQDKTQLTAFKNKANLSFPLIDYYENSILEKLFPVDTGKSTIVVLDHANRVRFISMLFLENDIKQLAEKFIIGEISYAPLERELSPAVGKCFPPMRVKNLKSGEHEYFPPAQGSFQNTLAIIFTSRCPSCLLSKLKKSSYSLEQRLLESGIEVSFIFSAKFTAEEVLEHCQDSAFDIFLAAGQIPLVEDYYNGIFYTGDEILAVNISNENRIISFDSLKNYLEAQKYFSVNKRGE